MAEETQVLSIKDRIAALNQTQVGRVPSDGPPFLRPQPTIPSSRPLVVRTKTVNNPPSNVSGSALDNASIGNQPASINSRPVHLPSPGPRAESTQTAAAGKSKAPPPPLPARRSSAQPAPALPPRRPSAEPSRKASQGSVSTTSSEKHGSTSDSNLSRVRAPAWGETELPPLPPKREEVKATRPSLSQRGSQWTKSSESLRSVLSNSAKCPPVPKLPPRRESADDRPVPLPPPRLPSRDNVEQARESIGANGHVRKLPPPPPVGADVDKIRQSGFGGRNSNGNVAEAVRTAANPVPNGGDHTRLSNGVPPPVPLASRPDLSKIQATKPRLQVSAASAASCLKCRDFSGPDAHAARFPRASLPTQDLAWLARELTAPFPSLTDKARAIFTWLHHNIAYDVDAFFNHGVKPSTPASTLASGLAVCEGYAGLFTALATHAGLESLVISGHGKGYGYQPLAPRSPIPPYSAGHAWNVVKIDNGYWKLIDACWGAGAVNGPGQPYIRRFEPNMFTFTNEEFGLKHFPGNKDHFFRDDGRSSIPWEEYIVGDGVEPLQIFCGVGKYDIGERTLRPAGKKIPVRQPSAGPIRFQFGLICEHWSLERNSKQRPSLFMLITHGVDGKTKDQIVFNHIPGAQAGGGAGGGDLWYVDVPDPRVLGMPGQTLMLVVLTTFGDRTDCRGLTMEEYQKGRGRVGMSWAGVAAWELV